MHDATARSFDADTTAAVGRPPVILENPLTQRFLDPARGSGRSLTAHTTEYDRLVLGWAKGHSLNRPILLDEHTQQTLTSDLDTFVSLMFSLPDRLFAGDLRAMMRSLDTPERQLEAMTALDRPGPPVTLGRADLYLEETGFRLLEFNASCSLGGWDMETLLHAYLDDPGFREFAERERLVCAPTLQLIMDAMHGEVGPLDTADRPMIALADWPHTLKNIRSVLDLVSTMLDRLGYRAAPCHLGELDHRTDGVYLHGERVDVVFRLFLPKGLTTGGEEAFELLDRLYQSVRADRVKLFADFALDLFCHKGCLALLSDERHASAFTTQERALIDRLLPWTRLLRDEQTQVHGTTVDLVTHVKANRQNLVLKPAFDYGGAGIVTGWNVDDAEWSAATDRALHGGYVVQQRARPTLERFLDEDTGELRPWVVNWGVFVTPSGYGGTLARGVPDPEASVISVGSGARLGGGFHVEPGSGGTR